ncbi:MAG: transporter substrate-binding domain-containing protein [Deltaproteobacteria bacterium]|nr:transporter substrate-binding domain-containing protein [Candidatus Zymogenaceae bacterium]
MRFDTIKDQRGKTYRYEGETRNFGLGSVAWVVIIAVLTALLSMSCSNNENNTVTVSPDSLSEMSTLNTILKRGKLIVGMDVSDVRYQPFEMKNANGELIGFDVDLAQLMADELGVSLEIVQTGWDGIIPALINRKFDVIISGMGVTTERNKVVNFSDPYYLSGKCLLIHINSAGIITSYRDLNTEDMVVATAFYSDMALDRYIPNASVIRYASDEEAVMDVIEGNSDAYIADKARVAIYARSYPDNTLALLTPFTYEPIAIGVRKGDPDFLNWINNFIRIINGDGRLAMLEQKWMVDYVYTTDWDLE